MFFHLQVIYLHSDSDNIRDGGANIDVDNNDDNDDKYNGAPADNGDNGASDAKGSTNDSADKSMGFPAALPRGSRCACQPRLESESSDENDGLEDVDTMNHTYTPPDGPANGPSNGYNKQLIEAGGTVNEGDETLVSELHQSVTKLLTIADIQCKPTPFRGSCSKYDLQSGCFEPS